MIAREGPQGRGAEPPSVRRRESGAIQPLRPSCALQKGLEVTLELRSRVIFVRRHVQDSRDVTRSHCLFRRRWNARRAERRRFLVEFSLPSSQKSRRRDQHPSVSSMRPVKWPLNNVALLSRAKNGISTHSHRGSRAMSQAEAAARARSIVARAPRVRGISRDRPVQAAFQCLTAVELRASMVA